MIRRLFLETPNIHPHFIPSSFSWSSATPQPPPTNTYSEAKSSYFQSISQCFILLGKLVLKPINLLFSFVEILRFQGRKQGLFVLQLVQSQRSIFYYLYFKTSLFATNQSHLSSITFQYVRRGIIFFFLFMSPVPGKYWRDISRT